MKRIMNILVLVIVALLLATPVYAGVFGKIGGWFNGEIVAVVVSAVIAILAGFATVAYTKIVNTLKETGEVLIAVANAVEDKRTTKEELSKITKEVREVVDIWKKTPEKYQVTNG